MRALAGGVQTDRGSHGRSFFVATCVAQYELRSKQGCEQTRYALTPPGGIAPLVGLGREADQRCEISGLPRGGQSGPAASKPISIMAATIVAEVAKRCGTAVRVTKCRIASGGSPSSDRVRPSGGFACGFVGNPLRGHLRQWCVRPGLPTTPQAQHQQKKPDFSRFKGSDRSAEGSREHGRSAEHVGRSKDGKPRWMTRFHRGDPCPAIRWHRTRTKRTDHELQKPDTLTS